MFVHTPADVKPYSLPSSAKFTEMIVLGSSVPAAVLGKIVGVGIPVSNSNIITVAAVISTPAVDVVPAAP